MKSIRYLLLILLFCTAILAIPATADDDFVLKQYAGTGDYAYKNILHPSLLSKNSEQTTAQSILRNVSETTTPEPTVTATPTPVPTYITGGTRLPYPESGNTPVVYPGNTVFVYEQIKIEILPGTYATSIAKMSGDATPVVMNTISADANGVINLLGASVAGETGAYRIYDGGTWTGGYIYVWNPELSLKAWLAGSTDSINGTSVSKSSSINFVVEAPRVGAENIGAQVKIVVTTPVGGKTTMLGSTDLSAISLNSVQVITPDIPLSAQDLTAGIYRCQAEWTVPAAFDYFASDSNSITFQLGSDASLGITVNKDTIVRSNPFTVTITGDPNTPYLVYLDAGGGSAVPQMIPGQLGVVRGDAGPTVSLDGAVKTVQPPSGTASNAKSWGVVTTDAGGRRVVEYSTQPVNGVVIAEGSYTIRVANIVDYGGSTAGAGSNSDRVNVRIQVGSVSISSGGDRSYYMGQEVKLTGTNTDSDTTYLFLTGPNLNSNGISLDGSGQFTSVSVKTDTTWSYTWDTGSSGLDTGVYTIYAVSTRSDKGQLSGTQYATISIQLMQPSLSVDSTTISAAKGDYVHITGSAVGNPSSVAIFLFGSNYYQRVTASVNNNRYDYKMYIPESMSSGEYYLVIEHPMYDGTFGVTEITRNGQTILALTGAGGSIQSSFVVEGPNRLQGSQAANALVQMLDSPYIDDLYSTMKLIVQEPYIMIDPVGTQEIGRSFVLSGSTNLAAGDQLLVEVVPTSFVPSGKDQPVPSSGVSGTVTIAGGSTQNVWSYPVSGSSLAADSYTVRVSGVAVTTSTSAVFEVVTALPTVPPTWVPTTVPSTPEPTEPVQTPFGQIGFVAVLGAVVLPVLRRH